MKLTPRFVTALLILLGIAPAQQKTVEPSRAPVKPEAPVQDKNFYLFSMIERTPEVRAAVSGDPTLARIDRARISALDDAAKSCRTDLGCYASRFQWSEEQSAEASRALAALYRTSAAVRKWIDGPLRASGLYVRYNDLSGDAFLERAWSDCIRGVNRMIDVYGIGKAPRYPAIDSMTYDATSDGYRRVVQSLAAVLEDDRASFDLFFAPSMRFALELMFLNHRDEAGRCEPMELGENSPAFQHVKSVE